MSLIADLARRVAALEKTVQMPRRARRRLNKRQVAEREGISTRTLDRHILYVGFPPPEMIRGRCYWWEDDLDAYDATLLQKAKRRV
jgi:predicted DNA-binding transcriptional regulator AlpA